MNPRALAVLAFLAVAGAGFFFFFQRSRELSLLQSAHAALEQRKGELTRFANDSDRHRRELERWPGAGADVVAVIAKYAPGIDASFDTRDGRLTLALRGRDRPHRALAALEVVAGWLPALRVTSLRLDATDWSLAGTYGADAAGLPGVAAATASSRSPSPPVPERAWYSGPESARVRERIRETQREIEALDEIVGDVEAAAARVAPLKASAESPDALARVLPVLQPLFAGDAPTLATGAVTVAGNRVSIGGAAVVAGRSAMDIAGLSVPGWSIAKLDAGPPVAVELERR